MTLITISSTIPGDFTLIGDGIGTKRFQDWNRMIKFIESEFCQETGIEIDDNIVKNVINDYIADNESLIVDKIKEKLKVSSSGR